jgi:hypothetical protein
MSMQFPVTIIEPETLLALVASAAMHIVYTVAGIKPVIVAAFVFAEVWTTCPDFERSFG